MRWAGWMWIALLVSYVFAGLVVTWFTGLCVWISVAALFGR